ncbi:TetR/AcrR family transcriptional regulator [Marinobacter panjinensis]|uniref:TetR/AcrR family transcriptional regulator n=1 Tax=Marinobacter panjinensis TaxID=2576384 RepID=A0A4U6QW68_9GAMM|nr:TetR/AcrR family transcriptional regulator [Marinobacter panjinensis]MCR8915007.1 TetR/AcrR family transcriptional regulator [Marinobacter panjinensis]TKV64246.1 TetR/AcrR family transcriptional regulator [Marinobacter panjinensis]
MPTNRSSATQERILAAAESLILERGFSSTGIDEIVDAAAITKSGFFYHYADKNEMAKALVRRYLKNDDQIFADLFTRADSLSEDPLQQLLIFLNLFAETMTNMELTHPGCLVVTFTYERYQTDEQVAEMVRRGVLNWRELIAQRLRKIATVYEPCMDVDLEELADMFTTVVEGGILLVRVFNQNKHLGKQLLLYRNFLRMIFGPASQRT